MQQSPAPLAYVSHYTRTANHNAELVLPQQYSLRPPTHRGMTRMNRRGWLVTLTGTVHPLQDN